MSCFDAVFRVVAAVGLAWSFIFPQPDIADVNGWAVEMKRRCWRSLCWITNLVITKRIVSIGQLSLLESFLLNAL